MMAPVTEGQCVQPHKKRRPLFTSCLIWPIRHGDTEIDQRDLKVTTALEMLKRPARPMGSRPMGSRPAPFGDSVSQRGPNEAPRGGPRIAPTTRVEATEREPQEALESQEPRNYTPERPKLPVISIDSANEDSELGSVPEPAPRIQLTVSDDDSSSHTREMPIVQVSSDDNYDRSERDPPPHVQMSGPVAPVASAPIAPSRSSQRTELDNSVQSRPTGTGRLPQTPYNSIGPEHDMSMHSMTRSENFNGSRRLPQPGDAPRPPPKRVPKTVCAGCENSVSFTQRIVRTDYGNYHANCFACFHCRQPLEHSQFYFSNVTQKIYCHLDYHYLFSPKCGYCETPVEDKGIFAVGKHWHKGHFFCADCSTAFSETDAYYVDGDHALCTSCQSKRSRLKCWKCQQSLSEVIEALGRYWCSSCFCCDDCTTQLDYTEFILRENGDLVCHNCEIRRIKHNCWD